MIRNDAHLQSRAKTHHVAVFPGKFFKPNCPKVLLRLSVTLVTKFGTSLTPGDSSFLMSLSSFNNMDCSRSPDACALGVPRKTMHPVVLSLASKGNLANPTLLVLSLLDASGTWEMQSVARCLAWLLLAF